MVDTSGKTETERVAVAEGWIRMSPEALAVVREGRAAKGDVLQIARIAGIAGAKRTSDLIPLCHPLPLDAVSVDVVATVITWLSFAPIWNERFAAVSSR